jgi:hypothetical protein
MGTDYYPEYKDNKILHLTVYNMMCIVLKQDPSFPFYNMMCIVLKQDPSFDRLSVKYVFHFFKRSLRRLLHSSIVYRSFEAIKFNKTMRASLSTWIKLAAAVSSMPVDLIHAFMNPPTSSSTLTLKNRRFHMQSQVGDNDQSSQFPNVTPSPPSPSPSPPIPFGIRLTGGPELNRDGYTGKGIKVAVIDSGIDKTHPGFREGKVKVGKKFEDDGSLKYHGTHVAGTIQ